MKKITIKTIEEVVLTIDYSEYVTVRPNKPIQTPSEIVKMLKETMQIPYYDKVKGDVFTKQIELVVYKDVVIVA